MIPYSVFTGQVLGFLQVSLVLSENTEYIRSNPIERGYVMGFVPTPIIGAIFAIQNVQRSQQNQQVQAAQQQQEQVPEPQKERSAFRTLFCPW